MKEKYSVKINSITEKDGIVSVTGDSEGLGLRKVEVIIDGDVNRRCVAKNNDDGTWSAFEIKLNPDDADEAAGNLKRIGRKISEWIGDK